MKKIFFLILIALPQILVAQFYQTTVVFVDQRDTSNIDWFSFKLKDDQQDCLKITSDDFIEIPLIKEAGGTCHTVWYNDYGVTSYTDFFGDFHCWAVILFDKKRIYLSN